jgi:hypothetical protein
LLVSTGVRVELWDLPAELNEEHSGDPFTTDDLLALHFELQGDGWFDRLVRGEI